MVLNEKVHVLVFINY